MTINRRLTIGDRARVIAELRAQLPPGYDPYDDHWSAPYDCDCCGQSLDECLDAESFLPPAKRYAGHPAERRYRRAS